MYSFLIVCAGILMLVAPFYRMSKWTLVVQAIIAVKLFMIAGKLFSAWEEKVKKIDMLAKRNRDEFRPDTFAVFMQAPCGRLIVRQVLRDLHKQDEYKSLIKLQKPLLERLRTNCAPAKTVIYINKDFL
jgi:membrane protein CcdC involved in cytochrome C biogenesis